MRVGVAACERRLAAFTAALRPSLAVHLGSAPVGASATRAGTTRAFSAAPTAGSAPKDAPLYVGAIDQGTSSSRFILFDRKGKNIKSHQVEFTQTYPHPGWVEHDPMEILASVNTCIAKVLADSHVKPHQIAAVGITNQRETTVVWDKHTGKPLYNAIVWSDTRTKDLCNRLIEKTGSVDHFRASCGLPISTYFSAMKLCWLIEDVRAVAQAVKDGRALFGTIDTWLLWNLTGGVRGGVHVTDVSNASRTMLMNLTTLDWDPQICKYLGIPLAVLPRIASSSEVYGTIGAGSALHHVPVASLIGDQQAAMMGQMCFRKGTAKNTYGTGCFMLLNTGTTPVASTRGLLTTVLFQLGRDQPAFYALEGSVAVAGMAVKWLRDSMHLVKSAPELDQLAESVSDSGGVYFVPAFSGLLSPHWRNDARGVIVGLSLYTTRQHLARATLEAACYQTREVLDAMAADSKVEMHVLKVDGGMANSALMLQFQADMLGIDVVRRKDLEATAAGAAYAAGLAVKFWTSTDELMKMHASDAVVTYTPKMEATRQEYLYSGWKKAVQRSFGLASEEDQFAKAKL